MAKVESNSANVNRGNVALGKEKKIKVMKRSTSGSNIDKKDKEKSKQTSTLDDKEKAYEEARARIFGKEAGPDAEGGSPAAAGEPERVGSVEQAPIQKKEDDKVNKNGTSKIHIAGGAPDKGSDMRSGNTRQASGATRQPLNGGEKGKNVNTSSWTGNKSIIRDRFAEQSDPDFARMPRYSAPPQFTNQPYNGAPGPFAPSMSYGPPPQGYGPDFGGIPPPPPQGFSDPRYGYVNNNVYGQPPPYNMRYPGQQRSPDGMYRDVPGGYGAMPPKQHASPVPSPKSPPDGDGYNSNFPPLG